MKKFRHLFFAQLLLASPLIESHVYSESIAPKKSPPTLKDLVNGTASFTSPTPSGLQMGESDTIRDPATGHLVSFAHHGKVHSKTAMADFVGCVSRWLDTSGTGRQFSMDEECIICRDNTDRCHMRQQQYPRVFKIDNNQLIMVFENQARTFINYSDDFGATWSKNFYIQGTGHTGCSGFDSIWGNQFHNQLKFNYDSKPNHCIAGAPPGLIVSPKDNQIYIFFAQGANPGHLGCMKAPLDTVLSKLQNPPKDKSGRDVYLITPDSTIFDFAPCHSDRRPILLGKGRFLSSADIVEESGIYYMIGEEEHFGIEGHKWRLFLAYSNQIDDGWKMAQRTFFPFENTPIADVGLGHGDLIKIDGRWFLFTTQGKQKERVRYELGWR